ncbi:glycine cleavage system aminomethyltransferase GcvT [Pelagicoccus sp. SDUM812005]|uniref:glycine cleavage system aminomethyltransferase GcvT n=1 Tax=Pelagicoccus sp. SDUM812005 TaxID=3041257 RepID=UPI00280F366F|nr:glycine cleavage system aminomethyltransferase GcvT [Pelagicoccus sp. SDUM812005]MDQ8179667.1 glycine cleavage system aminomethyltransferase GcvT [Pelagicoccus sp. SDUM812005]
MSDAKRTPLYDFNVAHGGRMVDFAGWEMPVQYTSIVDEHKATRAAAGLFDVSHMGEATVEGAGAEAFLNYVLTNDVSGMDDGKALYSLMCRPDGGVVDDLLVYRKAAGSYLLCLNASNVDKDLAWLAKEAAAFDVNLEDVSDSFGLIALQGPKAFEILAELSAADLSGLGYYRFVEGEVAGVPCLVSRTGYTGEVGVELFVPADRTAELAEALLAVGTPKGLMLAGLGARDSLRLEAGYSLYGHEIDDAVGPVEANLMWTVSLKKEGDFIGKAAILAKKAAGPDRKVIFFKTGGRRIARPGTDIVAGGEKVGTVVSGTFSPILNEAIGSALVKAAVAKSDELAVDLRGKAYPIERTRPPFLPLNPQA